MQSSPITVITVINNQLTNFAKLITMMDDRHAVIHAANKHVPVCFAFYVKDILIFSFRGGLPRLV